MRPDELDATLEVWRAASVARGRPGTGPRLAIARSMMQARGGITYVAVDPAIAGMARVETIGADRARISMVFVHPSRQRHGGGRAVLLQPPDEAHGREGGRSSLRADGVQSVTVGPGWDEFAGDSGVNSFHRGAGSKGRFPKQVRWLAADGRVLRSVRF